MTSDQYNELLNHIEKIISGTEWEGHIFTVGGCCRDLIMETEIKDVDLAVDLPLGGVSFAHWLLKQDLLVAPPVIFFKYATSMFTLREFPDIHLEAVQTRKGKYTAMIKKHPARVFGSIHDDAVRRDLTINSLYYNISTHKMVDPTHQGIEDIKHHILRTPSPAYIIFNDDPLRILRIIRFACKYGWKIDNRLMHKMKLFAPHLQELKYERIKIELDKIAATPDSQRAYRLLHRIKAIPIIKKMEEDNLNSPSPNRISPHKE